MRCDEVRARREAGEHAAQSSHRGRRRAAEPPERVSSAIFATRTSADARHTRACASSPVARSSAASSAASCHARSMPSHRWPRLSMSGSASQQQPRDVVALPSVGQLVFQDHHQLVTRDLLEDASGDQKAGPPDADQATRGKAMSSCQAGSETPGTVTRVPVRCTPRRNRFVARQRTRTRQSPSITRPTPTDADSDHDPLRSSRWCFEVHVAGTRARSRRTRAGPGHGARRNRKRSLARVTARGDRQRYEPVPRQRHSRCCGGAPAAKVASVTRIISCW